jgi:lipopolysaccharide assembly protein A
MTSSATASEPDPAGAPSGEIDDPFPAGQQVRFPDQYSGQPAPPETVQQHVVRRTRIGGVWIASASFAAVLFLLLIFILQNGNKVEISYFGAHGHLPLGVALLLSAVLGVLLVVIPGTARIVQLRLVARRHRRVDSRLDSR